MSKVELEKLKRIDGVHYYLENSFGLKKVKCSGFIKTMKNGNKIKFNGLVIDVEGTDCQVIDTLRESVKDAYYVRGTIESNKLNFTMLPNNLNSPLDYKLIKGGIDEYYGCSFSLAFDINYKELDKMILSYKNNLKDYARVCIKDLDEKTDKDIINKLFGSAMYSYYQNRIPINTVLRNLMIKEDSSTITEAFEKRSARIAKTLYKK